MVQLQHRPSTRVYPQTRNCAQTLKYYDGKVLTKTPNSRLHAAHSHVCSRLGMSLPCVVVLGITLLAFLLLRAGTGFRLYRAHGVVFLALYVAYLVWAVGKEY